MARDDEIAHEERSLAGARAWVIVSALVLVVSGGVLAVYVAVQPQWKPLKDFAALVLGTFGGALLSVVIGNIWWGTVTRNETQRNLAQAVTRMFSQDPKTVAKYFKDSEILGFVNKNVQARTGDPWLAQAITEDLIGPFVNGHGPGTRVRTSQTYTVNMKHSAGQDGLVPRAQSPIWLVSETLTYEERLPFSVHRGSVLAAFVFCESALTPWFAKADCMYRSIAYIPDDVAQGSPQDKKRWAQERLGCSIRVEGLCLALTPVFAFDGADPERWAVTFVLGSDDTDRIEELCAAAKAKAESTDGFAALNIDLRSTTTHSPHRHSYTAYLAYPTRGPVIEFHIEGPIDGVECSTFYSRAMPTPGAASADDVQIVPLDGAIGSSHLRVSLVRPRWVFPMSGACFSWTPSDCD